jgi:DNA polymerase-3 subunit gamma/tau
LEEPPAHVKFIFATTESHKVLPTILSRCQRFDFTRIPPGMISARLLEIAKKEKIDLEEKAALIIARNSDGSLRDALVILDQMISFSGEKVVAESVVELLGMVQKDKVFALAEAVIRADAARTAILADELISGGKDPVFIVNTLINHFRDIMILKTAGSPTQDMAFSGDELEGLKAQTSALSIEEVLYILQNLSHSLTLMKAAMFARAPMEIALIRLAMRKQALTLPEVLAGMNAQEGCSGNTSSSLAEKERASAHHSAAQHEHTRHERPISHPKGLAASSLETDDDPDEIEAAMPVVPVASSGKVHWSAVLNYVREKKMSVYTFLNAGKPMELTGQKVVIGFGKEHALNRDFLDSGDNRLIVEEAVGKVLGASPRVEFTVLEVLSGAPRNADTVSPVKKSREREELNPAIENIMDVFGGQVVRDINEDVT